MIDAAEEPVLEAVELSLEVGGEFADGDTVGTAAARVVADAVEGGVEGAA